MSRMAGLSRRGAAALSMALLAAIVTLGCGEDETSVVIEPARPFVVSVLDIGQRRYTLGDEIRATFSGDPGTVELDYGGRAPFTPIRIEGLTYTFLLETSRTVLRWGNGGSLSLKYAPLFAPDPPIPPLTDVWPKFDAQHVSYDNINTRTDVSLQFDTQPDHRDTIPRLRVDAASITGPRGETWRPVISTNLRGFSLARRPDDPYERAQTYRVQAQVTFIGAPDEPQTYDYQFRIQD